MLAHHSTIVASEMMRAPSPQHDWVQNKGKYFYHLVTVATTSNQVRKTLKTTAIGNLVHWHQNMNRSIDKVHDYNIAIEQKIV